ncbi:aldehyde dehydrogenase [Nemania sp. FL0031]|nr:aldehyde dehydrogenase [Nemania sp. FL0031]
MSSLNTTPLDFTTFYNVIGGQLRKGEETRRTVNPATLDANPDVPISTPGDVDEAIRAAQQASKHWAQVSWSERKKALKNFIVALEAHADDFIRILIYEQGKPPLWAKQEFELSTSFLKGFCNLSLPPETTEDTKERNVVTHYVPIGVTVGVTPWNYPVHSACGKLGPALLTGNAFILKPSPHTPYCSLKLAELGTHFFPPGVFQALSGNDNLGRLLTMHSGVNMVSFTGSASIGKKVMKQCSEALKRVTLELSGNDPAIVCADIDPVAVADKLTFFAFCNAGQICMSIKRVYVHDSVYDEVLSAMIKKTKSLKVGSDADSFLGPVANEAQFERLKGVYEDIETKGFKIAVGGTKPLQDRKGYFFPATVVDNPPDSATLVEQEQFGPVIPLLKWSDESDVIHRANNTDYGLGASVWTRDKSQATRIANQLEVGNVWINTHAETMPNTPFGGHKQSGIGTEWGVEGLKAYCNLRAVYTRTP